MQKRWNWMRRMTASESIPCNRRSDRPTSVMQRILATQDASDGRTRMAGSRDKTTIMEIAEKAGVSIATVSRILNRKDNVREETRRKVLDAMLALDYRVDLSDGIDSSSSTVILMSVPELRNPIYSAIFDGAQAAALRQGYHVLTHQVSDLNPTYEEYESLLKNCPAAGLLLLNSVSDTTLAEKLNERCPIVMCSEYCENVDVSYVSIEDRLAGKAATDYLISIGRKRIAMLNSAIGHKYARHREEGYRNALKQAGLSADPSWVVHLSDVNFDLALSAATHMLMSHHRPDAFFAVSDVYAAAVIKACRKMGLSVPQDISVVGFDNTDITQMTDPTITTVSQPGYQLGYQACDMLIAKVRNPGMPNRQILLETELIVRGSTNS